MSCRHDLANGTCSRCYPQTGNIDPGPEEDCEANLEGPGAVTCEEFLTKTLAETTGRDEEGKQSADRSVAASPAKSKTALFEPQQEPLYHTLLFHSLVLPAGAHRGIHHLKCHPDSFELSSRGDKSYEIRFDDREFVVGDLIFLHEWAADASTLREAEGYTGRECGPFQITCISTSEKIAVHSRGALGEGYVVLGLRPHKT